MAEIFAVFSHMDYFAITIASIVCEFYRKLSIFVCLFVLGATAPSGPWPPHSQGF